MHYYLQLIGSHDYDMYLTELTLHDIDYQYHLHDAEAITVMTPIASMNDIQARRVLEVLNNRGNLVCYTSVCARVSAVNLVSVSAIRSLNVRCSVSYHIWCPIQQGYEFMVSIKCKQCVMRQYVGRSLLIQSSLKITLCFSCLVKFFSRQNQIWTHNNNTTHARNSQLNHPTKQKRIFMQHYQHHYGCHWLGHHAIWLAIRYRQLVMIEQ
jgi:hypothetical protein